MKIRNAGFTLLEMGVMLIILSLMAGGILSIMTQNARIAKNAEMQAKFDRIEEALLRYRKEHGALPCPGGLDVPSTDDGYGYGSTKLGACEAESGNPNESAASFVDGNTVAGMLPSRVLGLTDDFILDPWGGKILYVVDNRATDPVNYAASLIDPTAIGSIIIMDEAGGERTNNAVVLLLSHGPNGHGAYQESGEVKYIGSSNASEQKNCHCTGSAPEPFENTFFLHPGKSATSILNSFDDIGRYYSRQQIASPSIDYITEY